jgi:hypothetical protein
VAFASDATNFDPVDENGATDIFVRDRQVGPNQTTRISLNQTNNEANGSSDHPAISASGRYISFASSATNLVVPDENGSADIYLRDYRRAIYESFAIKVNHAPVLDASKSPTLNSVRQNSDLPVGQVGTLISQLITNTGTLKNVSDADANSLRGIAITAANTTNGAWYYSTNNGFKWVELGSVSNTSARLLAADAGTRLYFKPKAGFTGSISSAITFRAWDRTRGSNGSLASTATSGGYSPFSSATDTASIDVT